MSGNIIFIDENDNHSAGVKCRNKAQLKPAKQNRLWEIFDAALTSQGDGPCYFRPSPRNKIKIMGQAYILGIRWWCSSFGMLKIVVND